MGSPGLLVAATVRTAARLAGWGLRLATEVVPVGSPGLLVAVTIRTAARLAGCGLRLATEPARTVMGRRGKSARVAESTMGPQDR